MSVYEDVQVGEIDSAGGGVTDTVRTIVSWMAGDREALFTLVALLGMALGFAAERFDLDAWATVGYVVAYVAGGAYGVHTTVISLRHGRIDIDLLMVLAALGAAVVGAPFEGAMLLFLFSLSNVLQKYALDRTRNAIRSLMKLRPDEALVRRGEDKVVAPVSELEVGDVIIVRPGERIAMDGVVVAGTSSVDQSPITGESLPVDKETGSDVMAGTINGHGGLDVRVTRLAEESTIARLIQLVEEAHSEKAETQRWLDTAEQYYAVGVIVFTILAIIVPQVAWDEPFRPAFYRAMTLMVAASPCALIISTPATVLSAIGNGARRGVLFKGGVYVEQAAGIKVVALDKTGTLTEGKPRVTDVVARGQHSEADVLALAAAVEEKSEHVLARAVVSAAQARNLDLAEASDFQAEAGQGVEAVVEGQRIRVGTLRYFAGLRVSGRDEAEQTLAELEAAGKTAVVVASRDGDAAEIMGVIAFADTLRANAAAVVQKLHDTGVEHVVMLTGDNERTAAAVAKEAGLDAYHAALLPEQKLALLRELEAEYGPVAMVGDGVNDAPALAAATIGIAMGAAGTDVALETADVVLMGDDLGNIPYVMALSRQTQRTLVANLSFAAAMIAIMIVAIIVGNMPLPLAVVGHEGGTVLVSLNGLRLLAYHWEGLSAGG